jgi:hypothetical protein
MYPESIESKIGIAEIFGGLGFLVGPVTGSLLYRLGGYICPFIVFGSLSLILVPIMAV